MTLSPVRVVVNADDLGMTREITRGIVEAHIHGVITSASLMVTTPWAEDAAAAALRCPDLGVGVHLTLTCGTPVAPPRSVPSLVNAQGRLKGLRRFIAQWAVGKVQQHHLETELDAQIRRATELGIRPTHLDGHHHLHLLPGILPIVMNLAAAHGITAVRFPKRLHLRPSRVFALFPWWMRALTGERRRNGFPRERVRSADHLWILIPEGRKPLWELYIDALEHTEEGLHEFVSHPGFTSPELEKIDTYTREREIELSALIRPEIRQVIRQRGIHMGHFGAFRL